MIKSNLKILKETIIKADAWCNSFEALINANIFEDQKIKIYSYLPDDIHKGKLGDLIIFEKKFMRFPKPVLIANRIAGDWTLEFFQNGEWLDYFALQIG